MDGPVGHVAERTQPATRWMALVGTVLYLTEFVFIFGFWKAWPKEATPTELFDFWSDNKTAISIATIGISVAILGRVAYAAALRDALRQRPRILPVADLGWALAVMAVTVEIVALTFMAVSSRMAATSESAAEIAEALIQGYVVDTGLPVLFSASAIVFSAALLRVSILKPWIGWIGVVGGAVYATSIMAPFSSLTVLSESVAPIGWFLIVVWMFAVSISLLRAGNRARQME